MLTSKKKKLPIIKTINFKDKLVIDSVWSVFGNVFGKGIALLAGIFIARFLGKEVYGEYGIIRNTILSIGVFSTFGLGYTATKFISELRVKCPEQIPIFIKYSNKITFIFSGLMALILFVTADLISTYWLKIPHLGFSLRILSILIVFNAITTSQIGILSGFGKFKEIAKINTTIGFLTFIFSALLTYLYNLNGALLALLIVQVFNCAFNFFVVKSELKKYEKAVGGDKRMLKNILIFSIPVALQEAIYSVTTWLSSVFLIRYASIGDLGLYTVVVQWNAIILFIPGILRNVVLSHLSMSNSNFQDHSNILKKTIFINFISTLVPCMFVLIFSSEIAASYGISFNDLDQLISLSVFTTIFTSVSNVYAQAFTSLNRNWLMLLLRTIRDILTIISFIILTKYKILSGVLALITSGLIFSMMFLLISFIVYKNINNELNYNTHK